MNVGARGSTPAGAEALREALAAAHLPSLLLALGALTGDPATFTRLLPDRLDVLDPQGGMSEAAQEHARELARQVLEAPAGYQRFSPQVDAAVARALLSPLLGEDFEQYWELASEELCLLSEDPRRPRWTRSEVAPQVPLDVVVIGAGMSGLLAAARLGQAGVEVVVLEKNAEPGGTWQENAYPGCRVDVPSHVYAYSAAPERDWRDFFASQPDVLDSLRRYAQETGVADRVRYNVEVTSLDWDDRRRRWRLTLRTAAGVEHLEATVVVNAVGQLNRPLIPDIPGRERFAGTAFHSAAWNHGACGDGARVGVIGTGASAIQFVPRLAETAARTIVFQRTPTWLIPTPEYTFPVDPGLRWLFQTVPGYQRWYRFWVLRQVSDAMLPYATVDPQWDDGGRSISKANHKFRAFLERYLRGQFAGRPDLFDNVVPDFPPFAKRAVRDNGSWAATLCRPDVELVTDPISEITPAGVRTADGRHHDCDVLVWGTGFHASKFLHPMRVIGRHGVDLHRVWGDEPGAYLGMTVPGFPNMFMLYGPNTNIVVNGSAIFFSECQVNHLLGCLRLLLERGGTPVECDPQTYERFRDRMAEANATRAWGLPTVSSWYKSSTGRVTQTWPLSVLEYWRLTRRVDPADYPTVSDAG